MVKVTNTNTRMQHRYSHKRHTIGRLPPLLAALLVARGTQAHGIADSRYFPESMTLENPAVATKLLLADSFIARPSIINGDRLNDTTIADPFDDLLTDDLAFSVDGSSTQWNRRVSNGRVVAQQPSLERASFCTHQPAGPAAIFRVPCLDDAYDAYEAFKAKSPLRLGAGAVHFWNIQRDTGKVTYGYPGAGGTYYYYVELDADNTVYDNQLQKFGLHTQVRFRDESLFRTFFSSRIWSYEGYGWIDTPVGTLKAGKIRNRIGLDWDGSYWANVPYLDGYKLNPDYGVSLEKTWQFNDKFRVDTFEQYFFASDHVNGSIPGGDSESSPGFDLHHSYILRIVPRWSFSKNMSLAAGVTGFDQSITNHLSILLPNGTILRHNETVKGYAVDVNFKAGALDVYAELLQSFGIRNPTHYVSGGPSDKSTLPSFSVSYQLGPTRLHASYSRGEYENPGGHQNFYEFGTDINLTKYLTLIAEYVNWTVQPDGGRTSKFEDGFEFFLNWAL